MKILFFEKDQWNYKPHIMLIRMTERKTIFTGMKEDLSLQIQQDPTDMKGHSWFRFTILKIILRYNFMPSNWIV